MRGLFPAIWGRSVEQAGGGEVPLTMLQREVNTLLDDFFKGCASHGDALGFVPRLDLRENEKEIIIKAELPGMDEKDVDVSLCGDVLFIIGEKKEEHTDLRKHRVETKYGAFRREVLLPQGLSIDKVDASFSKGVLTIILPKSPMEKSKKIEIKNK